MLKWKKSYDKPKQCIKTHRHHFANKGLYSQSYRFSSSCGWMWELDHKEGWVLKMWCFWIVVLEKTLENSLDSKKIKAVNPKGNQSWIFMGKTDAEVEAPILWPSDVKIWHWKRCWCWERLKTGRKGTAEDETVECHHRLNGHDFEQTQRWWRTGKPAMLQSMGFQRVRHNLVTEKQQQIVLSFIFINWLILISFKSIRKWITF